MNAGFRLSIPDRARDSAAWFVGRQWVLDRVVQWLDGNSSRFMLITGEPGSGKTALAAWLAGAGPPPDDAEAAAKLERIRRACDAVHFCVARGQLGTVDPLSFTRSLAEQLARHYERFAAAAIERLAPEINIQIEARENWGSIIGMQLGRLVIAATDALRVYNQVIREPLQILKEVQPEVSIVIVVDALDEALAAPEPNIVTLLAGSGDLPGVRFLLTSRREPKVTDQFTDDVDRLDLLVGSAAAEAGSADIRSYVSRRLRRNDLVRSLTSAEADGVVDRLVAQAEGNFLYVKLVLDEVVEGRRMLTELSGLPHGLYGLYRAILDRLLQQSAQSSGDLWLMRYEPLLGCITVATPAAPYIALPKWLGWREGELNNHLEQIHQLTEDVTDLPESESGYRLYHRSVAEFLTSNRYAENGTLRPNRYYVEPSRQHDRIASYYLQTFAEGNWTSSDEYGLQRLVGHLKGRLGLANDGAATLLQDLYRVALDPSFLEAQRQKLGGIHANLGDLRVALDIALTSAKGEDLLRAMRCVAAFRRISRSESISRAVFDAVNREDPLQATRKASHYSAGLSQRGGWTQVLQLYLAWEAAEAGLVDEAREGAHQANVLASATAPLADALITRIARALAGHSGDPRQWLVELGRGEEVDRLLAWYQLAAEPEADELQGVASEVEPLIKQLETLPAEASAQLVGTVLIEGSQPLVDPESAAGVANWLGERLCRIAGSTVGQELIVRALTPILRNPYPRYRDIGLVGLTVALLASPRRSWVRRHFQAVLRAGLDDEGVVFTFDLPTVLLAECERRGRLAPQLAGYIETARDHRDPWGTSMRTLSASAVVAFEKQGADQAMNLLREASTRSTTYAGYGVMGVLSLIDRCHEFGHPEYARARIWGEQGNLSLLELAGGFALHVYDPVFREERIQLVEQYMGWMDDSDLNLQGLQERLAVALDADLRRALICHVSARWAAEASDGNQQQLRALVPLVLLDSTALDAILARMFRLAARELTDQQLEDAVTTCATDFTVGRPWMLGNWR